eukprot:2430065-Rhodomonas_salina.4
MFAGGPDRQRQAARGSDCAKLRGEPASLPRGLAGCASVGLGQRAVCGGIARGVWGLRPRCRVGLHL